MDPARHSPPEPRYENYRAARRPQGGAAILLWIGIMVLFGVVALIGGVLNVPYLFVVLMVIGFGGLCLVAFIAHDTNTTVRLMREAAQEREPGENAWTRRHKED